MSNKPNRKPSHANRIAEAAEERKRRTGLIIGVLVVAVVVALLVALLARRSEEVTTAGGDGGGSGNPGTVVEGNIPYGGVNVQGAPLPEYKGEPDDAVGMTAPTLNGSSRPRARAPSSCSSPTGARTARPRCRGCRSTSTPTACPRT